MNDPPSESLFRRGSPTAGNVNELNSNRVSASRERGPIRVFSGRGHGKHRGRKVPSPGIVPSGRLTSVTPFGKEAPNSPRSASWTPPCMDSFRSTATKTEANSERISLTAYFARCYFIRPFCSSGWGRMHFGKSAAHSSPKKRAWRRQRALLNLEHRGSARASR